MTRFRWVRFVGILSIVVSTSWLVAGPAVPVHAANVAVCPATQPVAAIEENASAGKSSLQYDPEADQYTDIWKTNKTWANTCRQLRLTLADGTTHLASFKFR